MACRPVTTNEATTPIQLLCGKGCAWQILRPPHQYSSCVVENVGGNLLKVLGFGWDDDRYDVILLYSAIQCNTVQCSTVQYRGRPPDYSVKVHTWLMDLLPATTSVNPAATVVR